MNVNTETAREQFPECDLNSETRQRPPEAFTNSSSGIIIQHEDAGDVTELPPPYCARIMNRLISGCSEGVARSEGFHDSLGIVEASLSGIDTSEPTNISIP